LTVLYFILLLLAVLCFLAGAASKVVSAAVSLPWLGLFFFALVPLIQVARQL
jgi:hypothetical protein